jgi:hypothetical protein
MPQPSSLPPEAILRNYFHAKDENRAHFIDHVFTPDASLRIDNRSGDIAFPAVTQGRDAIADVLVRQFNRTYENIYSFYLARPPAIARSFSCAWLVGMTEKDGRRVRVGCGTYDWTFSAELPGLASRLVIGIHAMLILPPERIASVFPWLLGLSYPWSSPAQVSGSAPSLPELAPVLQPLLISEP